MTPTPSLRRCLALAAVLALGAAPFMLVAGPLVGRPWAAAAYGLGAVALYGAGIAGQPFRALTVGSLSSALGTLALILSPSPGLAMVAGALILAIVRGGLLFRAKAARTLLLEGALGVGALLVARALGGTAPLEAALGVWGFFFVQSLHSVLGGFTQRSSSSVPTDPFERACRQALALMEG